MSNQGPKRFRSLRIVGIKKKEKRTGPVRLGRDRPRWREASNLLQGKKNCPKHRKNEPPALPREWKKREHMKVMQAIGKREKFA